MREYLQALADVSRAAGRAVWSNAESFAFAVWGEGTNCRTIRSGPEARFEAQLAVEAPLVDALVSWEWHSYMSPYSGPCAWAPLAHAFYRNYTAYVHGAG